MSAAAKRGPGRPPAERAPDGNPARVRLCWTLIDGSPRVDLFSDEAGALRLLAAWGRCKAIPAGLVIERRGVNGWAAA